MNVLCIYSSEGRVDEDKIVIGCISDVHAQVILLGVIGIHAKNTFHFVGRIQLISNHLAILTNNESCIFNKKKKSFFDSPKLFSPRILFKVTTLRDSESPLNQTMRNIGIWFCNYKFELKLKKSASHKTP